MMAGVFVPTLGAVETTGIEFMKAAKARDWVFMHYSPVWIQEPARFAFETKWKLYGDGRLMALDQAHNTETEVPADQIKDIRPLITMVNGRIVHDAMPR